MYITKKRFLIKIIIAVMLLSCALFNDNGYAEEKENEDYTYVEKNSKITITKYKGKETELTIPNIIDGKPVVEIGENAFSNCSSLTNIEIPSGVTSIGDYAFSNCSSLRSIEIPSMVTSIGESAFKDCSNLIEVVFEGSKEPIFNNDCFDNIGKNAKAYILPDYDIESYPFKDGSPLKPIRIYEYTEINNEIIITKYNGLETEVIIPSKIDGKLVAKIGDNTFNDCINITNIKIPSGVKNIGDSAFYNCRNLIEVIFKGNIPPHFGLSCFSNIAENAKAYILHSRTKVTRSGM